MDNKEKAIIKAVKVPVPGVGRPDSVLGFWVRMMVGVEVGGAEVGIKVGVLRA